jgi:hypothetical protein
VGSELLQIALVLFRLVAEALVVQLPPLFVAYSEHCFADCFADCFEDGSEYLL